MADWVGSSKFGGARHEEVRLPSSFSIYFLFSSTCKVSTTSKQPQHTSLYRPLQIEVRVRARKSEIPGPFIQSIYFHSFINLETMSTRKGSPKISAFQDNFKNKKLHATFKLPDGDNFIRGTAPRLDCQ